MTTLTEKIGRVRNPREIVAGDALTWASLTTEELRVEHEILRRALETAYQQITLWAPIVANASTEARSEAWTFLADWKGFQKRFARRVAASVKHGPNGSGEIGPCDPDCLKCEAERRML